MAVSRRAGVRIDDVRSHILPIIGVGLSCFVSSLLLIWAHHSLAHGFRAFNMHHIGLVRHAVNDDVSNDGGAEIRAPYRWQDICSQRRPPTAAHERPRYRRHAPSPCPRSQSGASRRVSLDSPPAAFELESAHLMIPQVKSKAESPNRFCRGQPSSSCHRGGARERGNDSREGLCESRPRQRDCDRADGLLFGIIDPCSVNRQRANYCLITKAPITNILQKRSNSLLPPPPQSAPCRGAGFALSPS